LDYFSLKRKDKRGGGLFTCGRYGTEGIVRVKNDGTITERQASYSKKKQLSCAKKEKQKKKTKEPTPTPYQVNIFPSDLFKGSEGGGGEVEFSPCLDAIFI